MRDLEQHMCEVAKAALDSGTDNLVYVMREAFTAVYLEGFDDGRRAAERDRMAERRIDQLKEEARKNSGQ